MDVITLRKPRRTSRYLFVFLAAATVVTIASGLVSYRGLVRAAEDSLRLQAFGIAVSLEAYVLQWAPDKGNIFRDIITEGTWEAIAFLTLFDEDGTILLHSNDGLIGRKHHDPALSSALESGKPLTHGMVLGTGEEVFILDQPIFSDDGRRLLRLALHMQPTDAILRQAHLHLAAMAALTVLLWVIGIFLIIAARRSEALETTLREKQQLTVIGEMASVLAHEIRNPLGSIKGFAQYLLERTGSPDSTSGRREAAGSELLREDAREHLEIIVSESRRLEALTEDLLVYARPEEVREETFELKEFVQDLVVRMRSQTDQSKETVDLDIRIPAGLRITTDRDKLRQVLTNVLQNSLDAIDDRGRIEIRAEQAKDMISIVIRDNGAGMDSGTLRDAFKPFFTTKTRGTGLGLAIVDKLVRTLGGSVTIESAPETGTSLEIRIPLARRSQS